MFIRLRLSVTLAGVLTTLMTLAGCGNHGAPPYAPEPQQAVPTAARTAGAATLAGATQRPAIAPPEPDPHVLYDLREKCGEDARRWYQHFYDDGGVHPKQPVVSHGFTSHYDSRTNDCFALTSSITGIAELKSKQAELVEVQTLANVLENKDVGTFLKRADAAAPAECHVAQQVCKSSEEWRALTAPYMSD